MSISNEVLLKYKDSIKEIIEEGLKYAAYSYYKKNGHKYSPHVITEIDSNIRRMMKSMVKEMIAQEPAVKKLYLTAMRNCDLLTSSSESGASDEDESG
jgi:hypothetical protein